MSYNYETFIKMNNLRKEHTPNPNSILRIENVNFQEHRCLLSNGQVMDIKVLVNKILRTYICVKNPSALAKWHRFHENNGLFVCPDCFDAIESREGPQKAERYYLGFNFDTDEPCDCCGEFTDMAYRLISTEPKKR